MHSALLSQKGWFQKFMLCMKSCPFVLQEKITKNVEREILNHYTLVHVRACQNHSLSTVLATASLLLLTKY